MTILCQGLELGRFLMLQPIGHCFSFLGVSLRDPCPFGDIATVSFRSVCVEAPAMRSCRGRCRSTLLRRTVYGAPGLPPPSPLCTVLFFLFFRPRSQRWGAEGGGGLGVSQRARGWGTLPTRRVSSTLQQLRGRARALRSQTGEPPRPSVGRGGPRSGEREDRSLVTHKPQLSRGAREVLLMLLPAEMETGRSPGLGLPM